MIAVERHFTSGSKEMIRLCSESKNLYNRCNFFLRQWWFTNIAELQKDPNYSWQPMPVMGQMVKNVENLDCYKNLHNTKTAKQTIRKCLTDWTNFKKTLSAYKKNPSKFIRKPHPPGYKEKLAQVIFYNETIKKKPARNGIIEPTNTLFSIKSNRGFRQVVISPKTFGFVIEVQYEMSEKEKETTHEKQHVKLDKSHVCCIDMGVNNLCAISSDQHPPLLVNGRIVKAFNQWYNKNPCKRNSKKRYWRLENYFHHVSNLVVTNCLKHGIGRIIIGLNAGWKQESEMGRKGNQTFQSIPFFRLQQKIKYKAEAAGIEVVFTEEAYTSQASFLDRDPIPAYCKEAKPVMTGSRIKRGLYRSKNGTLVNADVNGSANIGRKVMNVIRNEDDDVLLRLDRSLAARPVRINPLRKQPGKEAVAGSSNVLPVDFYRIG